MKNVTWFAVILILSSFFIPAFQSVSALSVVSTIPVGIAPTGIAYDSAKGEVFVANDGTNTGYGITVSVISDTTNTVISTIPVGKEAVLGNPTLGIAYDSAKGEIFMTNDSSTVSVISDATNAVVDTIHVGGAPVGVAYDSGKGEVFVVNDASNNVSVISDATSAASAVPSTQSTQPIVIPSWIKNNAKWWSQGQVSDEEFVKGIQYLVQQGIMQIPQTQIGSGSSQQIPIWIKNNAGWWADGQISDDEFVKGIQYLISSGIMKIS